MSDKRRQHSAALKAQVGLEALKEIQPVNVIAAKHQEHPTQVNQWKPSGVVRGCLHAAWFDIRWLWGSKSRMPRYCPARLMIGFLVSICALQAGEVWPVLRSARAVRELNAAQANQAREAELSGVVLSRGDPEGDSFVLQDATDSLYMVGPAKFVRTLKPGDELVVHGHTDAGGFAPMLIVDRGVKTGVAPVPEPRRVTSDDLFMKGLDAQWIVVTGIVRDVRPLFPSEIPRGFVSALPSVPNQHGAGLVPRMKMSLAIGDRLVPVQLYDPLLPEQYVDAEVEVRGLVFNQHNADRRFVNPLIFIPPGLGVRVLGPPPIGPFDDPVIASATLFQFNPDGLSAHRVHIAGVVLHQRLGVGLWLRDGDRGMFVASESPIQVHPGDRIEVAGFPKRGDFSPLLEASVYRVIGTAPEPSPVAITDLTAAAQHDGDLVKIEGTLLDYKRNEDGGILRLDWLGTTLEAQWKGSSGLFDLPKFDSGTVLAIAGICLVSAERGAPLSGVLEPDKFRLLVRRSEDIVMVRAAPWWTGRRLEILLKSLAAMLTTALIVVFVVSRRKIAHERTLRALKVSEITARLAERSQMARDLHDSVAQGFGAISLQLQLAGHGHLSEPQNQHLSLAQQLVRTSQAEVRSFISNLRAHTQQDVDLASALAEMLRLTAEGTAIRTTFQVGGRVCKLTGSVEAHVLRVGQEAVTNAIRHSGATTLSVDLRYTLAKLILTVTDDGHGFNHTVDWSHNGHFGLLGMKERAALIGATLEIDSQAGSGVRVRFIVPVTGNCENDTSTPF